MSQRQQKVAHEVRHAAANALLRGDVLTAGWPRQVPLSRIALLDCWVSPDLRLARLYAQFPHTEELSQDDLLQAANTLLAKPLRKVLASQLATKFIPEVSFWPTEEV